MKIGIIGAMDEEVQSLQEQLQNKTLETFAGTEYWTGQLQGQDVVLARSGIGKVAAAITATLLCEHFDVDCLINTGSAGGIGKNLHIGDVVISTRLAYHDADVTAFGYAPGQMAQMPLYYEADAQLMEKAKQAAQKVALPVHIGEIVSGDQFVHSQEKIAEIQAQFPQALANEMEATAIAQVAYQFQKPFVVIRAMSDVADEEAHLSFDEFIQEAGQRSAEMVCALLAQFEA